MDVLRGGLFGGPQGNDPRPVFARLEEQALASFSRFFDDQTDWIDAHLADVRQQQASKHAADSTAHVARLIQTPSRQKAAHAQRSPGKPAIAPLRFPDRENVSPARKADPPAVDRVHSPLAGASRSAPHDVFGSPVPRANPIARMRSPPPRAGSPPVKTLLSPAKILDAADLPPHQPSSSPVKEAQDEDEKLISPRVAELGLGDGNLSIISEGTEPEDNGLGRSTRMLSNSILAALASPPLPTLPSINHFPSITSPLKESTTVIQGSSPAPADLVAPIEPKKSDPPMPKAQTPESGLKQISSDVQATVKQEEVVKVCTDLYLGRSQVTSAQPVQPAAEPARKSTPAAATPSRLPTPASPRAASQTARPTSPRPLSPRPLSPRPASPAPSRIARAVEVPLRDSTIGTTAGFNRSLHRTPTSSLFSMPATSTVGKRLSGGGLPLPPSPTSTFLVNHAARQSTFTFGGLKRDEPAHPSSGPKAMRTSFLATATAAAAAATSTTSAALPSEPVASTSRLPLKRKSSVEQVEQPAKAAKVSSPVATKSGDRIEALRNRLEQISKTRASVNTTSVAVAQPAEVVSTPAEAAKDFASSPPRPPRSPARPVLSPIQLSEPVRLSGTKDAALEESEKMEARPEPVQVVAERTSPEKDAEYGMVHVSGAAAMPGSFAEADMMVDEEPLASITPLKSPLLETTTPPFSPPQNQAENATITLADIDIPASADDADVELEGDTLPDIPTEDDAMSLYEVEQALVAKPQTSLDDADLTASAHAFPTPPAQAKSVAKIVAEKTHTLKPAASSGSLASSHSVTATIASAAVGVISGIFSKSAGPSTLVPAPAVEPKPKGGIKSLQQAKEAREKERLHKEAKEQQKEERRRIGEERKARETNADLKRKDRDGSQLTKSAISRPKTPGPDDEPAKKRKVGTEAGRASELRKTQGSTAGPSRPASALGQSSASQLRPTAAKAAPPAAASMSASQPAATKAKLPNSVSATGSALIGHKFMPDPSTLRTANNPAPLTSSIKIVAPQPAAAKAGPSKSATTKPVAGPSRVSNKPTLSQARVSQKILQQAALEADVQIDLPDIDSEYSDPEDHAGHIKRDKERVQWAQSPQMRAALKIQENFNPDGLFGKVEASVDLEALFVGTATRPSRVRPRSSSAVWLHDKLTEAEKEAYNEKRYGNV